MASNGKLTIDLNNWLKNLMQPVGGLDDLLLIEPPEVVLPTVALAFSHDDPRRVSDWSLGTVMAALFAAGADVRLTSDDIAAICSEPQHFASGFCRSNIPEVPNDRFVRYAIEAARRRGPTAKREDVKDSLRFRLSNGRVHNPEFRKGDDRTRLLTVAFASLSTHPNDVTAPALARSMAAIYGAGTLLKFADHDLARIIRVAEEDLHGLFKTSMALVIGSAAARAMEDVG